MTDNYQTQSDSAVLCTANGEFLAGPRRLHDTNGWLGHSAAVPQHGEYWGTAALCPSHPSPLVAANGRAVTLRALRFNQNCRVFL
jgi:hypothetical protein